MELCESTGGILGHTVLHLYLNLKKKLTVKLKTLSAAYIYHVFERKDFQLLSFLNSAFWCNKLAFNK